MTPFEKLKACLTDCKIPFETTDDSSEYPMKDEKGNLLEIKDTVIVLTGEANKGTKQTYIFFNKEGDFKDDISVV